MLLTQLVLEVGIHMLAVDFLIRIQSIYHQLDCNITRIVCERSVDEKRGRCEGKLSGAPERSHSDQGELS
jgi:hypothetical protein